eukprot:364595-Chlamydomonas_euryale.AAC.4
MLIHLDLHQNRASGWCEYMHDFIIALYSCSASFHRKQVCAMASMQHTLGIIAEKRLLVGASLQPFQGLKAGCADVLTIEGNGATAGEPAIGAIGARRHIVLYALSISRGVPKLKFGK